MRALSSLIAAILVCNLQAQTELTQNVRGRILDASNGLPLVGATISVRGTDPLLGAVSDTTGIFSIDNVPVGRYVLEARFTGYRPKAVAEILVNSGKEAVLEIYLQADPTYLDELLITSTSTLSQRSISSKEITVEKTNRVAANFFDPARLVTSYPGIAADNDQSNNLTVRGNSPNHFNWRLEGLDIVNPNHLTNTGTFSDRPTQNGGGVNILSAQMLSRSQFLNGSLPPAYGNSLSGTMDMHFRRGNNEKNEYTAQIGLLGLDFAAEGPFNTNHRSSFLANYRYSTLGLLTSLGVDFGDEEIKFQDLSFMLSFPTSAGGEFAIFGMGGMSSNRFDGNRDSTRWEFQKDRFDIDFESKMGGLGVSYHLPLDPRMSLSTGLLYSTSQSERAANYLDQSLTLKQADFDENIQSLVSVRTAINTQLNPNDDLETGVYLSWTDQSIASFQQRVDSIPPFRMDGAGTWWLLQPYLNWFHRFSAKWDMNLGVRYLHQSLGNSQAVEPTAMVSWRPERHHIIKLGYAGQSQSQLPGTYFFTQTLLNDLDVYPNRKLDFTRSHGVDFTHQWAGQTGLSLTTQLFYQKLYHVPIANDPNSSFSVLNLLEGFVTDSLVNNGEGENYGVEMIVEKQLTNDYYVIGGGTWYESTYLAGDGVVRDTRYNGKYSLNLAGGKEMSRRRNKIFGVNARIIYRGGFKDTPIDEDASRLSRTTVYMEESAFSISLPDYFRLDMRFSWTRQKPNYTRIISIDIQNLTNTENTAYYYFDFQKDQVVEETQLGIIPILTYRIEF